MAPLPTAVVDMLAPAVSMIETEARRGAQETTRGKIIEVSRRYAADYTSRDFREGIPAIIEVVDAPNPYDNDIGTCDGCERDMCVDCNECHHCGE